MVPDTPVLSYTPSYPGTPLDYGDYNNNVLIIQFQLNRIAGNYPAIPKISPARGDFNLITVAAVRKFQSIFGLASTGTVDEATWYQISYIYTVVKRLSELESEGVEYTSYTQILPTEIGLGYSGIGIDLLQYFLSVIGLFNSSFPQVQITGVFDNVTEEAVKDLQINNALPVTGVVDKTTWDLLYDQFLGISFILPSLLTRVPIEPYDGVVLRQGSTGERVELLQRYLNGVAGVYTDVPTVEVLGIFGPQTYNSVLQFQRMFGLTADGVVGRNTWEMLLDVYESTLRRQNPDVPQYPGYPLLEIAWLNTYVIIIIGNVSDSGNARTVRYPVPLTSANSRIRNSDAGIFFTSPLLHQIIVSNTPAATADCRSVSPIGWHTRIPRGTARLAASSSSHFPWILSGRIYCFTICPIIPVLSSRARIFV